MKPSELVAKAMANSGCDSRYKLAQQTEIKQQRLSDWANDKTWPDSLGAAILAEAAGLDPWLTICELEEERCTTEAQKTAWSRFLVAARVRVARLVADATAGLKMALPGLFAPAVAVVAVQLFMEGLPALLERLRIIPSFVI